MTEIEIDVESGEMIPLSIPLTSTDVRVISAPAYLCGWSLREASGDLAAQLEGNLLSPGGGAVIATSAALPAGNYDVQWTVELTGTAAAADGNNFRLFAGGVNKVASVNQGAAGVYVQPTERITLAAPGTIQIQSGGAGTVGVTYSVSVSIVPADFPDAVVEIQDGGNPIAEVGIPVSDDSSRSFGRHGMKVRSDITLHIVSGTITGAVYARY